MKQTIIGMSYEEGQEYIKMIREKFPDRNLSSIHIEADGDYADIHYEFEHRPFERVRRITGYLVGTLNRWNNAKRSEERDRVKHDA